MKFLKINLLLLVTVTVFGLASATKEKNSAESVEDEMEDIDPESMEKRELGMEEVYEPGASALNPVQPRHYPFLKFRKCPHRRQTWNNFPPESMDNNNFPCNSMALHQNGGRMCPRDFSCCFTFARASQLRCVPNINFQPDYNNNQAEAIFP